jgi:hypothetical protein
VVAPVSSLLAVLQQGPWVQSWSLHWRSQEN